MNPRAKTHSHIGKGGAQKTEMTALSISCRADFKKAVETAASREHSNPSQWVIRELLPKLRRRNLLR